MSEERKKLKIKLIAFWLVAISVLFYVIALLFDARYIAAWFSAVFAFFCIGMAAKTEQAIANIDEDEKFNREINGGA